jgi:hypothetical protein
MSEQPEERNRDSKKTAKDNIEQPGPVDKQDPTEPVTVGSGGGSSSGREGKASGGATGT